MLLAASRAGALVNGNVRRRTRHVNIAFASRVPVDIVALMRFRHCYHSAMKTAIDACYVRNPRCPGKFPGLRCRKRIADSEGHGLVTVYAIEHPDGKWSLLLDVVVSLPCVRKGLECGEQMENLRCSMSDATLCAIDTLLRLPDEHAAP